MTETRKERDALAWLDGEMQGPCPRATHARTLKAMLAAPRLPKEPTTEAIAAMVRRSSTPLDMQAVYRALYAHLSKPATKMVEMWEVRYAFYHSGKWLASSTVYPSRETCESFQRDHEPDTQQYACWSIVGPISREVPA